MQTWELNYKIDLGLLSVSKTDILNLERSRKNYLPNIERRIIRNIASASAGKKARAKVQPTEEKRF